MLVFSLLEAFKSFEHEHVFERIAERHERRITHEVFAGRSDVPLSVQFFPPAFPARVVEQHLDGFVIERYLRTLRIGWHR